ncbi:plasmid mobilization protein [uncultured Slackia sp.]|uniref:plasmid mobilization protein n=1 Tax=uncultured Slackia sp. TaxID=665903 RepID=UPI0025E20B74|nr:hypothetical protein [uncultured Slackia sp.]
MEVRLTEAERDEIFRRAASAGVTASDYVRRRALQDDDRPVIRTDAETLRRIYVNGKRAGNLLNQCARVLNTTRSPVDVETELRAALRAVEASSVEVSEFLAGARNSL